MQDVQQLMRPQNVRDQRGKVIAKRPPVIPTKFMSTLKLKSDQYTLCLACKLATAKARSSDVMTQKPVASKEGALSRDICMSQGTAFPLTNLWSRLLDD